MDRSSQVLISGFDLIFGSHGFFWNCFWMVFAYARRLEAGREDSAITGVLGSVGTIVASSWRNSRHNVILTSKLIAYSVLHT